MKTIRFIKGGIAALLAVCMLPATAFAANWYLEDGDITVYATQSQQKVTQGSTTKEDDSPVITMRNTETTTENTISIRSSGGATAKLTIEDLRVDHYGSDDSLIDVVDSSSADVTVKGKNYLDIYNDEGTQSAVHVGAGSLTIRGDGLLDITSNSAGAKIGSNVGEDMSGSIHITGNVTITTDEDGSCDAAAIGTGDQSGSSDANLTGSILIDGNANVTAVSNEEGAGIGTGDGGDITQTGSITIGGNATVYARGDDDSTGIGTGETGKMQGSIVIEGNADVTAIGDSKGAGIGSGEFDPITEDGSITIRGNAQVKAYGGTSAAAIGSGDKEDMLGTISILDNADVTVATYSDGEPIAGTGYIGDGNGLNHDSDDGRYIISSNAGINGVAGDDVDGLRRLVGFREGGENLAIVRNSPVFVRLITYTVIDTKGNALSYSSNTVRTSTLDVILTISAKSDSAVFREDLAALEEGGVTELVFKTNLRQSTIKLSELNAKTGIIELTHNGTEAVLTVDGEEINYK